MEKALCTIILAVVLLSSPFLSSCKEHKGKKHKKKENPEEIVKGAGNPLATGSTAANCDTALWRYVYNPDRLQVIAYCKTVTGVIEESNADEDGDQHMLLKLDKGQEDLLTKRNYKKKQGDLVIEAVCVNKVMLKKVGSTCEGYINHVQIPRVGDHVRVSGSLVDDTHNGWNEIHPITKVEIIR